jgi:hypothetical protein
MLTDREESQREFVIDPELVLRESTGPAAQNASRQKHKKAACG